MTNSLDFIEKQKDRYNKEAYQHAFHHGHQINQMYRTIFYRDRLFNFNLKDQLILDAMCASGIETEYLIEKGDDVIGLDISDKNAEIYQNKWKRPCKIESIHQTSFADNTFDIVYINSGLHHIIPFLKETFQEAYRILKPNGYLVFVEPNKDTWLDTIREAWYHLDKRFQESEAALSYKTQIKPYLNLGFEECDIFYGGNLAYLLIYSSLILKTPQSIKQLTHNFLFKVESKIQKLPLVPKLFFAVKWNKIC